MIKIRGGNLDDRKKQRKKRAIIIITVSLVLFSAISLIIGRSKTKIETIFSDSIAVVEYYLIKSPIKFTTEIFSEFAELKNVYEENKILKEKLDSYASVDANNSILANELEKLKEITEINYLPTDYAIKYAKTMSRDVDSWNSKISIDVGSLGGVEEGMVVVSSKGMIGVVTSTTEVSATVSLLSSEKFANQLPVEIINGGQSVFGLLDKYDVATGYYEVTLLSEIDKLEKGSIVMTSGLGGNGKSPKGILIGTGEEIRLKSDGMTTKMYVKPAANFNDLGYVAVLLRVNGNE